MTDFINLKLPKIQVPTEIPSERLWPLAVVFKPFGGDWHLYAVAKGKNDGVPIMGQYFRVSQMGTWALVDRQSGMVMEQWPKP